VVAPPVTVPVNVAEPVIDVAQFIRFGFMRLVVAIAGIIPIIMIIIRDTRASLGLHPPLPPLPPFGLGVLFFAIFNTSI
jgi:hypothetical protein